MAGNAWEWLGSAPTRRRDRGTTGLRDDETARLRDDETARPRDHGTTRLRDNETTRQQSYKTTRLHVCEKCGHRPQYPEVPKSRSLVIPEKHRRSQAFSGVPSCAWLCVAARYRAWLIKEFREIREFKDVRAMPATNQVSDVLPLYRAARSLTSLNSLISLNSLLTARYHHAPKQQALRTTPTARVIG